MKKYILLVLISTSSFSQEIVNQKDQDSLIKTLNLDEVTVNAIKAKYNTPVTFVNVTKQDLDKVNLAQDIPTLLKNTPSIISHSDSGSGIGYSSIRIRGSDQTRVNVTINGVPYNDSESMQVYWVDLPDFASSIESIQVQRGVGTSTNGPGAFGGSINIQTNAASENSFFEVNNTLGSYNTIKNSVGFSTGFINNFELSGRISRIKSDGYIDRSGSNLRSYFLQGIYRDENTLVKLLNFAGHEITDQAWYGIDSVTLESNRKYNMAGEFYDEKGNTLYYKDQIDNYKQDHYQLHWNQNYLGGWTSNFGLHYTYGRGFYENYNVGYDSSDYIDRRWLDNDFYVLNFSTNYKSDNLDFIFNGSFSDYDGDHFGEVLWARTFSADGKIRDRYYDGNGKKTDLSFFTKVVYSINNFELFGDLQFRNLKYTTSGTTSDLVEMLLNKKHNFFNPKFGVSYKLNSNSILYSSYSRANREPNRTDYENNNNVKPEQLDDFEIGWRYRNKNITLNVNSYLMIYNDQLVLTGALDDVGNPIRNNSGSSHRLGLEIESFYSINNLFDLNTSLSFSSNKNKSYISNFNGQLVDFGNTNISFSPDFVASNALVYTIDDNSSLSLLSKYVGKQYMSNTDSEFSLLNSYFINDLNFSHEFGNTYVFDSITFSLLVNNVFNVEYVSNGYYYTYDDSWSDPSRVTTIEGTGYYPQATRNFLAGIQLRF